MTQHFGIIGNPLTHSYSSKWFNQQFCMNKIDAVYDNYVLKDISNIRELIFNKNIKGLNVTYPFKTKIIKYLDSLTTVAELIKAVNVVYNKDGKLIGHNTDCIGFKRALEPMLNINQKHHALVLGTGGAAKAVCFALKNMNINFQVVSRKAQESIITYTQVDENTILNHDIIINCTPLGMKPYEKSFPQIPYKYINNNHLLFDLIYNPSPTVFLQKGSEQGAKTTDGMKMLIYQAQEAWNFFEL